MPHHEIGPGEIAGNTRAVSTCAEPMRVSAEKTPANSASDENGRTATLAEALIRAFDRLHLQAGAVEDATRSAPWRIGLPAPQASFYLVIEGECRFEEKPGEIRSLSADDLLIVGEGVGGTLFAEFSTSVDDSTFGKAVEPRAAKCHSTRVVSVGFSVRHGNASWLTQFTPPVCQIDGNSPEFRPWIKELCRLIVIDDGDEMVHHAAVMNRLLTILYIKAVKGATATAQFGGKTSIEQKFDPDIAAAIGHMHQRPEFPWTVASLADAVGLSRSTLAARFAAIVGVPPAQFLRDLRMERAIELLEESDCGLKDVARQVGYKTFSAFSNAFRRCARTSPGEYRRMHQGHGADVSHG